ncbi:uncharacterized protein LOC111384311 isoform X1 [Olea europaea var. sylvestris]|uniref:uncharacterized protein LOC111384311 isoform X1 n=1 Tax=Olea europaea var. sylvestris TaxID=158386 RepID=UPI000C1CF516|nr:uncharacterized protein LOC111384311 isoform X1 [Olea europaea var. sylvestris]XP_022864778.1 uncharacterized protein LOC111384311 isoform X1 [Olea europaea var. sylvestris]XP_022864901.1 uncharacterized protein LOC111384311 isoform X1 [Olea europaea var. sylvestris]XP_022865035.1 uncharacterized protein LOC111384311 isoform X1 [Olea europaea var. sylvestris]
MDREKAKDYRISFQSYDGGFGLIRGSESHGLAPIESTAELTGSQKFSSVSVWCRGRHKTVAFKGWRSSKDLGTTNSLMREGGLHGFLLTCQSELLLQLGSDSYLSFFAVIVQFGSGLHATVLESMLYIFYYI